MEATLREQVDAAHAANGTGAEVPNVDDATGGLFASTAQGTLDGAWETVVGGKQPTHRKVRLQGGAIEIEPPEDGWKKGSAYELTLVVKCGGVDVRDTEDKETGQVIDTSQTFILKPRRAVLAFESPVDDPSVL